MHAKLLSKAGEQERSKEKRNLCHRWESFSLLFITWWDQRNPPHKPPLMRRRRVVKSLKETEKHADLVRIFASSHRDIRPAVWAARIAVQLLLLLP
jgi:hypothetical protein